MHRYIGIDVHTESCTFAIMGPTGKRFKETTIETNGKVLTDTVRSIAGKKHVCIEEGTHAEWVYELLHPLVDDIVVTIPDKSGAAKAIRAMPGDVPTRCDGEASVVSVFKAPDRFTALRASVKTYIVTQRDMVRTKSRLNCLYRSRGMQGMSSAIYDPERRLSWLSRLLPSAQRCQAELLSMQLDGLVQTHERARGSMLEESKKVPIVKLIETAPGIGEIRAPLIVAIVISPFRFRTRRQFWSYCGLAVVTRSSADWTKIERADGCARSLPKLGDSIATDSRCSRVFSRGPQKSWPITCRTIRSRSPTIARPLREPNPISHSSRLLVASPALCWPCGKTRRSTTRPGSSKQTHAWSLVRWLLSIGDFAQQNRFREAASLGPLVTRRSEQAPFRGYALSELPTEAMAHEAQPRGWCPTFPVGTPLASSSPASLVALLSRPSHPSCTSETLRIRYLRDQHRSRGLSADHPMSGEVRLARVCP